MKCIQRSQYNVMSINSQYWQLLQIFIYKFSPSKCVTQIWNNLIEFKQVPKSYEIFLSELKYSNFSKKDRVVSTNQLTKTESSHCSFHGHRSVLAILINDMNVCWFNGFGARSTLNAKCFSIKSWAYCIWHFCNAFSYYSQHACNRKLSRW